MPAARVQRPAWPALRGWLDAQGGVAGLIDTLRGPRAAAAHELDEARELLAYWERRARRLPRWALVRRREARAMAARWRMRVADAERARYGAGMLGAVSQYALERRMPADVAHRSRQAARLTVYAAAVAAMTLLVVLWRRPRPSPTSCCSAVLRGARGALRTRIPG